jgi:hypothetical protein
MDDGTGTAVDPSIGSISGSFNGDPQWVSDSTLQGGFGVSLDGTDDYIEADTNPPFISVGSDWSIGITIDVSSALASGVEVFNWGDGTNGFYLLKDDGVLQVNYFNGSNAADTSDVSEPSAPYRIRLLTTWDSSANSIELHKNATTEADTGVSSADAATNDTFVIGAQNNGVDEMTGIVDDYIGYNAILDSDGIQQDYSIQPWS